MLVQDNYQEEKSCDKRHNNNNNNNNNNITLKSDFGVRHCFKRIVRVIKRT